jgi:hypothetical protein
MERPTHSFTFNCRDISANKTNEISTNNFEFRMYHKEEDPDNTNRLVVKSSDFQVELLPSKGLSVGQVYKNGKPVFWEPPIGLPNPDSLDLWSDEILRNGKPAEGFTYLKTFMAGIEFYGLRNWGMPQRQGGVLQPLHGETSNIPIETLQVHIYDERVEAKGSFIYREFNAENGKVWYLNGPALCEVTKKIIIHKYNTSLQLFDTIKNVTPHPIVPDWGYHITFKPEDGSRLLVASKKVEERSGSKVPADIETWLPAKDNTVRTETGIIHKNIKVTEDGLNTSLLLYPDGRAIGIKTRPSPYFQTWFCNGGAFTREFIFADSGKPVFEKNWDGQGLEFGSSPLDHNGNIDESVQYTGLLEPGKSIFLDTLIEFPVKYELQEIKKEITDYQNNRN